MTAEGLIKKDLKGYRISVVIFLASLVLLLFSVVDIRRGFLFSGYFKVGFPSTLFNLDPRHLPLLLIGALGVWLSYKYMAKAEKSLKVRQESLKTLAKILAIAIGAVLIIDLFTYRGVPASRFLVSGEMGVGPGPMGLGEAIPVGGFPGWLQPAAEGINYLLVVWHATLLGLLLGSLFLVAGAGLVTRMQGSSFGAHLIGTSVSLVQPFCSCCAAPVGTALYRKGASLGPVLAFIVCSPMLNITGLILAAALLPTRFALLRIIGGVIVGVFITRGVSVLAARWVSRDASGEKEGGLFEWSTKIVAAYSRLFQFEKLFSHDTVDSPRALISSWLGMAGRLARVMVPVLLVGSALAVYIVQLMPANGNNTIGVVGMAFFGTMLMVPTWTEIPFALALINNGLPGIASVALISLPAVSLPSLLVTAGAIRSLKVAVLLGLSVFIAGILAGILFL